MTSEIIVANLKCHGCANSIKGKLSTIEGVEAVSVDNDKDSVTIEHAESVDRGTLTSTLHSMGYPEATEENGLLTQLKSYVSCMTGRLKG